MPTRLDTIDATLASRLAQATPEQQRAAAAEAALLAASVTRLSGDVVEAASTALRQRRTDAGLRQQLDELTERLDDDGFDLQEQVDNGQATAQQYEAAFARARATSALSYALTEDAEEAAIESIYEAHAAVGDIARLHQVVDPILGR
jgi:hypothetical protein